MSTAVLPQAKKAKTAARTATKKSPWEGKMEAVEKFRDEGGFLGAMLVRGVASDEEDDDDDKLTVEELSSCRFMMLTTQKDAKIDEMDDMVLGDQAGRSFFMFDTNFSNTVQGLVLYHFKGMYTKKKSWSEKFDMLLGLTMSLNSHSIWMHDNEGDMASVVEQLTKFWRAILKKSDDQLGIDAEYSRPGTVALLESFKKKIEDFGDECELGEFNFEYR